MRQGLEFYRSRAAAGIGLALFVVALSSTLCASAALAADETGAACAAAGAAQREVPAEIQRHLHDWEMIANLNRIAQVVLGSIGIGAALVVSIFTEQLGTRLVKIFSLASALSFGVVSAFDVSGKADSTRNGWRHLNAAILKFQTDPCFSYDALIAAYSEGEAMVGNVPFRPQGADAASGAEKNK